MPRSLVTPEKKKQYNSKYYHRNCERRKHFIDVKQLKAAKVVEVLYPGCCSHDRMSKAEFDRHDDREFPTGTRVWIGATTWEIK